MTVYNNFISFSSFDFRMIFSNKGKKILKYFSDLVTNSIIELNKFGVFLDNFF